MAGRATAGRLTGRRCSWRPACPGSSRPATYGTGPSSGSPRRSAKGPPPSSSCTSTWPARADKIRSLREIIPNMGKDLRESPEYAAVAEHLRRLHEPAFGRPHFVTDVVATADASRIVVTGSVYDELEGLPRTALYEVRDSGLQALTSGGGSARAGRLAPDGSALAFLSDRARAEVFQLYLLGGGELGEAWSPDGTRILLGVAGFGAEMSDAQGSGTAGAGDSGLPSWYPEVESGTADD